MKRIMILILTFALLIGLVSCKDKGEESISISLDKTEIKYGEEINVNVSGSNDTVNVLFSDSTVLSYNDLKITANNDVSTTTNVVVTFIVGDYSEMKMVTVKPIFELVAPTNIKISDTGLITWDKVSGVDGYVVKINNNNKLTNTNSYQVGSVYNDFTYSVASVKGENKSDFSEEFNFKAKDFFANVTVGIKGSSEIKSGKSMTLESVVANAGSKTDVTWSIISGKEYATISEDGVLTAAEVNGDKIIEVCCTSNANTKAKATKIITIVSKPTLTQEMLDVLDTDVIGYEGFININIYSIGLYSDLQATYTNVIKTSMDGTNWYAEYENSSTGLTQSIYYKNHDELACQVGVSFYNEEMFEPLLDDDGNKVSWFDGGLYNSFKGLTVDDFTFNTDTWRYEYTGNDSTLDKRMISSADPYDFKANGFALIIEENEILGIYAKSLDDYGILENYRAVQELIVAINYADTVVVPSISKYTHDDIHDVLNEALDNMRDLDSYTVNYLETSATYYSSTYVQSGFVEKITEADCYYVPYSVTYDLQGNIIEHSNEDGAYGYHKFNDNLYNSYYLNEEAYTPNRAYNASIELAKPSFGFAGEIFTAYYNDEEDGTITYYVDSVMCSVASTFYYGVGNDINLYGIFATTGYTSTNSSFTPYVTVKDGYIINSGFYYYLGSIYGVIELTYSDFNSTILGEEITFEPRLVPTSWSELTINVSSDSSSTAEDVETNALDYLKEYFDDPDIEDRMPFFGNPLGDSYGFGLTTVYIPSGSKKACIAIVMYYDVPLDIDYTIDSSLESIYEYLIDLGFEKDGNYIFTKDDICVQPVDSSLDLLVYVWKAN